jgi:hypothetical protein
LGIKLAKSAVFIELLTSRDCRVFGVSEGFPLLAMQKVESSSLFSRFTESPAIAGLFCCLAGSQFVPKGRRYQPALPTWAQKPSHTIERVSEEMPDGSPSTIQTSNCATSRSGRRLVGDYRKPEVDDATRCVYLGRAVAVGGGRNRRVGNGVSTGDA